MKSLKKELQSFKHNHQIADNTGTLQKYLKEKEKLTLKAEQKRHEETSGRHRKALNLVCSVGGFKWVHIC